MEEIKISVTPCLIDVDENESMSAERTESVINVLEVLKKYIHLVISREGVDFVPTSTNDRMSDHPVFTESEILFLKEISSNHGK